MKCVLTDTLGMKLSNTLNNRDEKSIFPKIYAKKRKRSTEGTTHGLRVLSDNLRNLPPDSVTASITTQDFFGTHLS